MNKNLGARLCVVVAAVCVGILAARLPLSAEGNEVRQSAPTGAIFGRVVLTDNTPLPRAEIFVKRVGPDAERFARAAADGGFAIHNLPAGEYQIVVVEGGRRAWVRERERIADVAVNLGAIRMDGSSISCECMMSVTPITGLRAVIAAGTARVLRSWLFIEPDSGTTTSEPRVTGFLRRPVDFGVQTICLCGRSLETLGRAMNLELPPGWYSLTAAAAGYQTIVKRSVQVRDDNRLVEVELEWVPADDSAIEGRAQAGLASHEVLVRVEAFSIKTWIAVDGRIEDGARFLRLVDDHAFDNSILSRGERVLARQSWRLNDLDGLPFGFSILGPRVVSFTDVGYLIAGAGEGAQTIGRLIEPDDAFRQPGSLPEPLPVMAVTRVRSGR